MKKTKKIFLVWETSETDDSYWLTFDSLDDALDHANHNQIIYEAFPKKSGKAKRSIELVK